MLKLSKKDSPCLGEAGVAHLLVPLILLTGIFATYFLVTHPAIFKPKAASDPASAVTVKVDGKVVSCPDKVCAIDSTDPNFPVEFSIDVKALNEQAALQNNSSNRGGRVPQ